MGTNGIVKVKRTEANDGNGVFGGTISVRFSPSTLLEETHVTWLMAELGACSLLYPHAKLVVDFDEVLCASLSSTGELSSISERVKARGGELALCAGPHIAHKPYDNLPPNNSIKYKAVA